MCVVCLLFVILLYFALHYNTLWMKDQEIQYIHYTIVNDEVAEC